MSRFWNCAKAVGRCLETCAKALVTCVEEIVVEFAERTELVIGVFALVAIVEVTANVAVLYTAGTPLLTCVIAGFLVWTGYTAFVSICMLCLQTAVRVRQSFKVVPGRAMSSQEDVAKNSN
jgi:hypothetical protein